MRSRSLLRYPGQSMTASIDRISPWLWTCETASRKTARAADSESHDGPWLTRLKISRQRSSQE